MDDYVEEWWLEDAESRNKEGPDSFFIPDAAKRHALVPGDGVKLIFRFTPGIDGVDGERMWVEVTSSDSGQYEGVLLNEPEVMRSIQAGARITFGPEHVAAFAYTVEEIGFDPDLLAWARVESASPRGMRPARASMRSVESSAPTESDSGWVLGRGDETAAEYMDDAVFRWADLGWLTDLHPELEEVFRAGGGDWAWDDSATAYVRLEHDPT